jgi:L-lactate dehydrogenase (cytochrome)
MSVVETVPNVHIDRKSMPWRHAQRWSLDHTRHGRFPWQRAGEGGKGMRLERLFNVADIREAAASALPRPIFDYIDGGADDEITQRRNSEAFQGYELLPSVLCAGNLQLATRALGCALSWPLILSPTGLTRMFHDDAEIAVARAAERQGLPYCLSTMATTTIEELAKATAGPKLFQIYIFKDRGLTNEFIFRAKASGYKGLVLTVDTPVAGNRERDRVNGLSLPPGLTSKTLLSFARHPAWAWGALRGRRFNFANVAHKIDKLSKGPMSLFQYIDDQFDPHIGWGDLERLAALWGGPLAVKGIMRPEDSVRAVQCGATAVMISNHGGRQLDSAPAVIEQIASNVEALQGRAEVICDGGIRRGSDIVKALALGATACSVGRPYLYGLAAAGEPGVDHVLAILRAEFERTLILAGIKNIGTISADRIRQRH